MRKVRIDMKERTPWVIRHGHKWLSAPLLIIVMILGSFAVNGAESIWNYFINTPKYALMCGGQGVPMVTHAGVVRYTVKGDIFEIYKKGDLWYPSMAVKGFNCMIQSIDGPVPEVKMGPSDKAAPTIPHPQ